MVRRKRSAGLPWVVAFAPILLVVGSFSAFALKRALFGNVHVPSNSMVAPLINFVGWCGVGMLLTLLSRWSET
jgi:hypothetical protein